jgi:hypothetical protein
MDRYLFILHALPSTQNMNATIQLGKLPLAPLALWASHKEVSLSSRCSAPLPPPEYARANKSLIATVPRLEIRVNHSFQRRKHFLTATRIAFCAHANFLSGSASFTTPPKINRKPELMVPPASYRKQKPGTQINRQPSPDSRFPFSHSPNSPVAGLQNDPDYAEIRRSKGIPSQPPPPREILNLLCIHSRISLPLSPPGTRMLLSGKRPAPSKANRTHPRPRLFFTRTICKGDS